MRRLSTKWTRFPLLPHKRFLISQRSFSFGAPGTRAALLQKVKSDGLPFFLWWTVVSYGIVYGAATLMNKGYVGGADAKLLLEKLGVERLVDVEKAMGTTFILGPFVFTGSFASDLTLCFVVIETAGQVAVVPISAVTYPYVKNMFLFAAAPMFRLISRRKTKGATS